MPKNTSPSPRNPLTTLLTTLTALLSLCAVTACDQETAAPQQAASPEITMQQELTSLGRELFNQRCTSCHGRQGSGLGSRNGPSLQRAEFTYGNSKEDILFTLRNGRPGGMPSFAAHFDEQQLEALAAYVLYLKN